MPEGVVLLRPFIAKARQRFSTTEFPLPLSENGIRLALAVPSAEDAQRLAQLLTAKVGRNLVKGTPLSAVNLLESGDDPDSAASRSFLLRVRLKSTSPELQSEVVTKKFALRQLLAINALPILMLIVQGRPGHDAVATDGDHSVVVMAHPGTLTRAQTCLTVMDEPDTIDPDANDLEDPRAELRRFFLVCAIENRGSAVAHLVSPGVLATLRGVESPEWTRYRETGIADAAWEASLREDWPGKQDSLQAMVEEWNRFPLLELSPAAVAVGHHRDLEARFGDSAPGSFLMRMVDRSIVGAPEKHTFQIDSLPPWWESPFRPLPKNGLTTGDSELEVQETLSPKSPMNIPADGTGEGGQAAEGRISNASPAALIGKFVTWPAMAILLISGGVLTLLIVLFPRKDGSFLRRMAWGVGVMLILFGVVSFAIITRQTNTVTHNPPPRS